MEWYEKLSWILVGLAFALLLLVYLKKTLFGL